MTAAVREALIRAANSAWDGGAVTTEAMVEFLLPVVERIVAARVAATEERLARVEAVLSDEWRYEPPTALYPDGRRLYRWPGDLRDEILAALRPALPDEAGEGE